MKTIAIATISPLGRLRRRATSPAVGIAGLVVAEWHNEHGVLIHRSEQPNIVTSVGDQYYAGRAALASGLPAQATGMRLGTGATAASKTGAGAAIVTYVTTSNKAFDATFPTAVAGVVTYKRTYAAGEGTSASAITEVVINNDTIANDNATTATAANTISRALLASPAAKAAADTLTITWTHTLLGA